jgi:O-antigen/teichoic acid export membrane protein
MKKTIKPLIMLFLPQIASQIYGVLARTTVGVLSTPSEVAYYDYSQKIIRIILSLINSIGIVLMPRIANISTKNYNDKIPSIIENTFILVSYISIPMSFGMMSISNKLISWFLGAEYIKVGNLICISAIIIIAVSWANIIGIQYLVATNQESKYTFSIILSAIINIIMNLLLIKSHGALGAVISLVCAEFFGIIMQMILVRHQLNIKRMLMSTIKYFIGSIIMSIFVISVGKYINEGFISNIIQVIIGILVYVFIMHILNDSIQKNIFMRLKFIRINNL